MLSTVLWTVAGLFGLGVLGSKDKDEQVKYAIFATAVGFMAYKVGGM